MNTLKVTEVLQYKEVINVDRTTRDISMGNV
jgi:hypothetical protein